MSKISCYIIAMLSFSVSFHATAQETTSQIHKGKVISASTFLSGHLTSSNFETLDTRWSQLPGYGWSTGLGVQLNLYNKWGMEFDIGYETNVYSYDHGNFRIELPYKVLFLDVKATKFFRFKKNHFRFWYTKIGGAIHFGNGRILSQDSFNFSYSSKTSSETLYSVMPEIGIHFNLDGNHSLQVGLASKISFDTMLSSSLNAFPEFNTVTGTASGSYFGITAKYFFAFKSLGGSSTDGEHSNSYRKNI